MVRTTLKSIVLIGVEETDGKVSQGRGLNMRSGYMEIKRSLVGGPEKGFEIHGRPRDRKEVNDRLHRRKKGTLREQRSEGVSPAQKRVLKIFSALSPF